MSAPKVQYDDKASLHAFLSSMLRQFVNSKQDSAVCEFDAGIGERNFHVVFDVRISDIQELP